MSEKNELDRLEELIVERLHNHLVSGKLMGLSGTSPLQAARDELNRVRDWMADVIRKDSGRPGPAIVCPDHEDIFHRGYAAAREDAEKGHDELEKQYGMKKWWSPTQKAEVDDMLCAMKPHAA